MCQWTFENVTLTFVFLLFISLFPLHRFAFVSYPLAPHMLRPYFKIILKSLIVGRLYFTPLSSIGTLHSGVLKDNFSCKLQSFSLPNSSLPKLFSPLFMQSRYLILLFVVNEGDLPRGKRWLLPERLIQIRPSNEKDFSKADDFAKEEQPLCFIECDEFDVVALK